MAMLQGAFRPLVASLLPCPMLGIGRSALTIFHWKIVRARLTPVRIFLQRRMVQGGGAEGMALALTCGPNPRMTLRCP